MKLPLCAHCGEEMTERARRKRADSLMIMLDHPREPHRPRYGWHGNCAEADPLGQVALGRTERLPSVEAIVAVIEARGPGRVVRRKAP